MQQKKAPEIAENNVVAKEAVTGQDTAESDEKVKENNGREEMMVTTPLIKERTI